MDMFYYILAASVATALTRLLPFFIFKKSTHNNTLIFLQKNSGIVIMCILLVYAIKSLDVSVFGTCVGVGCAVLAIILQALRRNFLLSIIFSTAAYMFMLSFFGDKF